MRFKNAAGLDNTYSVGVKCSHQTLLRALQARHGTVAHGLAHGTRAPALRWSTPNDLSTSGKHFVSKSGLWYNALSTVSSPNAITLHIIWTSP